MRIGVHGGGAKQSQPEPEESVIQVKQTATMILKQLTRWRMKNRGSEAGRREVLGGVGLRRHRVWAGDGQVSGDLR